ncbi:TPA: hypothetical protein DCZ15_03470 [Candidatus Falkowbacteria bacterium]|nr:MAG: hypothetical protein UV95_C0002G0081 [Candidatus Falkowbacteria bacterium GW2011_GWF2_43_32]HBA36907.1 hypothetical protein [Candidatus Falkowbacteria bacterium]
MSKDKNLDKDIDLKRYRDSGGISLSSLNLGLWLAENRRKLIRTLIVFLIAVSAFFFIYSSYHYIVYFLTDDLSQQLDSNNLLLSPRKVTTDLELGAPLVFSSNGAYDLAVKLKNPNDKFMATFNYCFRQAETDIACAAGFILPGEEKYILALGRELIDSQAGVSLEITDFFWRRINVHNIPDWQKFFAERLGFVVSGLKFTPAPTSGDAAKVALNTLEFSVRNATSYAYYEVPLRIEFYNDQELRGVNRYLLADFLSGEERAVKISWPGDLRGVNRTEIKPDVNIIDETVYLKYQGTKQ